MVKDGSKISNLMDCFTQREIIDTEEFPATSKRVQELKTTEGGASAVCDIVQKLVNEGHEKGRAEGRAEGCAEGVDRMAALTSTLLFNGLIKELERATKDPQYREELFQKYNI